MPLSILRSSVVGFRPERAEHCRQQFSLLDRPIDLPPRDKPRTDDTWSGESSSGRAESALNRTLHRLSLKPVHHLGALDP
jgi:hypothetical protein